MINKQNMILKRIFYPAVIGILCASCDPSTQFKSEIDEIDSLQSIVTDYEEKYESIDFDSLKIIVAHIEQNESDIEKYYIPDTINMELARQLMFSKEVRKKMTGADSKKMIFGDEVNAIKHQLINLKSDVKEGVLTKEEINGYIGSERSAILNFEHPFSEFYELQLYAKEVYSLDVVKVDSFIQSIKLAKIEEVE